jgi:DHA2 family multidrug resistance protein
VRAQAYTLATSDGFVLIVWVVIVYLLLMLLLRPGKITFNDLSKMQDRTIVCKTKAEEPLRFPSL